MWGESLECTLVDIPDRLDTLGNVGTVYIEGEMNEMRKTVFYIW